jgi:hypothetical protein
MYYDPDYSSTSYYNLSTTKRYSVLRHFTKAAPVGSVRRNVTASATSEPNWRVFAFDTDPACAPFGSCSAAPFSVVAMNAQWAAANLTLVGDGFELGTPRAMFRTSVEEDWAEVEVPPIGEDGEVVIEAPEMSIYTIFF